MQVYAIGKLLLLLRIGKHVSQLSVATARVASQRVLMQRAVAKALFSPTGIAGAAVSAGVVRVAKDRLGVSTSKLLLPPPLPLDGDPLEELRSSFVLALALVLGLAVILAVSCSHLQYRRKKEAELLTLKLTLVSTAWEKHAAALQRLDWTAVAATYHSDAALVVSVLGETDSEDDGNSVVHGDECGVHGIIEWLQTARSELDPSFGGDPALFTLAEKATTVHKGNNIDKVTTDGKSNTDERSGPNVHSLGSQQQRVVVEVNETSRTVLKLWRSAAFTGCDLYSFGPPDHEQIGGSSLIVYQKSTVKKLQPEESRDDNLVNLQASNSSCSPASSRARRYRCQRHYVDTRGADSADLHDTHVHNFSPRRSSKESSRHPSPGRLFDPDCAECRAATASPQARTGLVYSSSFDDILDNSVDSNVDEEAGHSFAGGSVYSEDGKHVLSSNGWRRIQDQGSDSDKEDGTDDDFNKEDTKKHVPGSNGSYCPAPESPERVRRATTAAVESARRYGNRGNSVDRVSFSSSGSSTSTSNINNVYDAPADISDREGGYLGVTAAAAAAFRRLSPAEERAERVANAVGRSVFKAATEDAADKLWSHLRSIVFGPRGLKWARNVFVSFDYNRTGRLRPVQFEESLVSLGAAEHATLPAAVLAEIMAAVHAVSRSQSPGKKYRGSSSSSSGVTEVSYDELIQCLRMWGPQPFKARRYERWDAIRLSSPTKTSAVTARHTTDDVRSSKIEVNIPARTESGKRSQTYGSPGCILGVDKTMPTLHKAEFSPELSKVWNVRSAVSPPAPPPTPVDKLFDGFEAEDKMEIHKKEAINGLQTEAPQKERRATKRLEEKFEGVNYKSVEAEGNPTTKSSTGGKSVMIPEFVQPSSLTLHSPTSAAELPINSPKVIPALRSPYSLLPSMAALMGNAAPAAPDYKADENSTVQSIRSSVTNNDASKLRTFNSHDEKAVSYVEAPDTANGDKASDEASLELLGLPSAKSRYIAATAPPPPPAAAASPATVLSPPIRQPNMRSPSSRGAVAAAVEAVKVTPTITKANTKKTRTITNSEVTPTVATTTTTTTTATGVLNSPPSSTSKWSTPPSVRECAAADWRAMEAERDRANRTNGHSFFDSPSRPNHLQSTRHTT